MRGSWSRLRRAKCWAMADLADLADLVDDGNLTRETPGCSGPGS